MNDTPSSGGPANPITPSTFDYAPIAVVVVLAFATVPWLAGGRKHFMRGPSRSDPESAAEIVGECRR